MDYIFNEKLHKSKKKYDNLPETTIPKMNNIFSYGDQPMN